MTANTDPALRELVDGRIKIQLTSDDYDQARKVANERFQSYSAGRTRDTNFGGASGQGQMKKGVLVEIALTRLYEEAELDRSVSDSGDGGVDAEMHLGGHEYAVDVKSMPIPDGELLVKKGSEQESTDVYVLAYLDTDTGYDDDFELEDANYVEFVGWTPKELLCQEQNVDDSPASHLNHSNYVKGEDFLPMDVPDATDDYEVV